LSKCNQLFNFSRSQQVQRFFYHFLCRQAAAYGIMPGMPVHTHTGRLFLCKKQTPVKGAGKCYREKNELLVKLLERNG
jgi:hypothetical protein